MAQFQQAPTETPLQKFIKKMLKRWLDTGVPAGYEGGVNYDAHGAIDDGSYGDPMRDDRPAFIREDEVGWQTLDGH